MKASQVSFGATVVYDKDFGLNLVSKDSKISVARLNEAMEIIKAHPSKDEFKVSDKGPVRPGGVHEFSFRNTTKDRLVLTGTTSEREFMLKIADYFKKLKI